MTQVGVAVPGTRSATADVDVCRPRPVTSLTTPDGAVGVRDERVDERRLADAGVPDEHRRAPVERGAHVVEPVDDRVPPTDCLARW